MTGRDLGTAGRGWAWGWAPLGGTWAYGRGLGMVGRELGMAGRGWA